MKTRFTPSGLNVAIHEFRALLIPIVYHPLVITREEFCGYALQALNILNFDYSIHILLAQNMHLFPSLEWRIKYCALQ